MAILGNRGWSLDPGERSVSKHGCFGCRQIPILINLKRHNTIVHEFVPTRPIIKTLPKFAAACITLWTGLLIVVWMVCTFRATRSQLILGLDGFKLFSKSCLVLSRLISNHMASLLLPWLGSRGSHAVFFSMPSGAMGWSSRREEHRSRSLSTSSVRYILNKNVFGTRRQTAQVAL